MDYQIKTTMTETIRRGDRSSFEKIIRSLHRIYRFAAQKKPNFFDDSIGMICTSVPFGAQYEYTESK